MPRSLVAAGPGARTRSDPEERLHVFYIHGFASSPRSVKAAYVAARCRAEGFAFHCRDFNEPSFETLTVSRMLSQLESDVRASGAGRLALIGSSLGGLVAWLAAGRWSARPERWAVERVVLLAPALDFGRNRARELGDDGMRAWRETGWREFYHYAAGGPQRVHYGLYEDALGHDAAAARVTVPTLVFQGIHDTLVDPAMVRRFAAARPNLSLQLLDDDHQLVASLPAIWALIEPFLTEGPR